MPSVSPLLAQLIERLPLAPAQRVLVAQLVRFVLVGGFVTVLGAGLYALLVQLTAIHEQLAVLAAYLVCVVVGYGLHSRVSFAGHGERADPRAQTLRFVAVSLLSYMLNAFFTWALVKGLAMPRWTPVLPILFVTPIATFTLNRHWVFR